MRQWFAELCSSLPSTYEVDWVRAYQPSGSMQVGCDPPSHPTKIYIANNAGKYQFEDMEVPLKGVAPGGGSCVDDGDCGINGTCVDGTCVCNDVGWTGPQCKSQAAGDSLTCRPFEGDALEIEVRDRIPQPLHSCPPVRPPARLLARRNGPQHRDPAPRKHTCCAGARDRTVGEALCHHRRRGGRSGAHVRRTAV